MKRGGSSITALNPSSSIYHDQKIVKDRCFRTTCCSRRHPTGRRGLNPPKGIWCHITGTDLVRDGDGTLYVLEDNLRCPSGVSYVLENRELMKRSLPQFFEIGRVRSVEQYPSKLLDILQHLAPDGIPQPRVAVLTGIYNSRLF